MKDCHVCAQLCTTGFPTIWATSSYTNPNLAVRTYAKKVAARVAHNSASCAFALTFWLSVESASGFGDSVKDGIFTGTRLCGIVPSGAGCRAELFRCL